MKMKKTLKNIICFRLHVSRRRGRPIICLQSGEGEIALLAKLGWGRNHKLKFIKIILIIQLNLPIIIGIKKLLSQDNEELNSLLCTYRISLKRPECKIMKIRCFPLFHISFHYWVEKEYFSVLRNGRLFFGNPVVFVLVLASVWIECSKKGSRQLLLNWLAYTSANFAV